MFAALNTLEPPIVELGMAMLFERDKSWYEERLPILEDRVRVRLGELSRRLGDAEWLDGAFSAGDLMMVTVLRRLNASGLLEEYPEPLRLCRPRRSAARLPAGVRCATGGVHRRIDQQIEAAPLTEAGTYSESHTSNGRRRASSDRMTLRTMRKDCCQPVAPAIRLEVEEPDINRPASSQEGTA